MVGAGGSDKNEAGGQPISWPWYVRWLAVAYVLSMAAGPVGFFVLAGVAAFRIARHGLGGGAALAVAAALACFLACAAFRAWFRNWGRRHWPDAEPDAAADGGGM